MKKPKIIKAIHINYFDDLSKPEVTLDGEFVVRDINRIQMFVNKAFEKYRREKIIEAKKATSEEEEKEDARPESAA